jgi:galactose mutarotase-like enzyme
MLTLAAGPATLRVDRAHGGRLASLVVHGHEVLVQPEPGQPPDPLQWGCYPMAPFAGRTRGGRFRWGGTVHELVANHAGHAMHGTVFDARWLIEQADSGYLRLRARLDPGWPFAGWAVQEMALSPQQLELRLEVHSADLPFPATAGWHPWFRRRLAVGGSVQVDLQAGRWYPTGPDGLPTGTLEPVPPTRPWDDCFTAITWPVTLTWPGALELSLTSTCDHVVLYDHPRHAVCVEPQSGPPDALNIDRARIVRRHDPLVIEAAISWIVP